MVRSLAVGALAALFAAPTSAAAQQSNRWAAARCDLKPGHHLVNSGVLYLKSATESRFEDQKLKDLRDAHRVLTQALSTGGQEKNPAAWYYFGRYYLLINDLLGADSVFTKAEELKPACREDIETWRKFVWVPTLNAGIAAWQAGNLDSAIASFRRANAILKTEPMGFKYMASVQYQAGQIDSAAYYFRLTADAAAKDTAALQDRKDALFNLARIHHSQQRWGEAERGYREFLTLVPGDAEALASLGSVLSQTGQRDSAFAIYREIIARGDSVGSLPLLRAGVEIFQSVPDAPDTVAIGRECRRQGLPAGRAVPPARVRQCRDSMTALMRAHTAVATQAHQLAGQAFEAGVKLNPYLRDGLYNLANAYLAMNDSVKMLPVARRLVAVDPMNRSSLRLLAFAHQRLGNLDSTVHYLRIADSTLAAEVSVVEFDPQDQNAEVKGTVTAFRAVAAQPFKLAIEFLNVQGEVVGSQTVEVPALAPQQSHAFEAKVIGSGITAYRYRKEG